jgi:hypothetical protein
MGTTEANLNNSGSLVATISPMSCCSTLLRRPSTPRRSSSTRSSSNCSISVAMPKKSFANLLREVRPAIEYRTYSRYLSIFTSKGIFLRFVRGFFYTTMSDPCRHLDCGWTPNSNVSSRPRIPKRARISKRHKRTVRFSAFVSRELWYRGNPATRQARAILLDGGTGQFFGAGAPPARIDSSELLPELTCCLT